MDFNSKDVYTKSTYNTSEELEKVLASRTRNNSYNDTIESTSIFGINDQKMLAVENRLLELNIKMQKIFSDMNTIVDGLGEYYKCDCVNTFIEKFKITSSNFPVVQKNISKYASDFKYVREKIMMNTKDGAEKILIFNEEEK